jgi:hypothetical protein
MLRGLILAIIDAMLRILAAFLAGSWKAMPRSVALQCHLPVQAEAFGPICVAFEGPRPLGRRPLKPPDLEVVKGGWTG